MPVKDDLGRNIICTAADFDRKLTESIRLAQSKPKPSNIITALKEQIQAQQKTQKNTDNSLIQETIKVNILLNRF